MSPPPNRRNQKHVPTGDPRNLNDLFYFAKVVEAGGFAAAGRLLGIPKSRLSRRIAELEERLDTRLIQRTTRKLQLTTLGERYLRHCQAMLIEADLADEMVASAASVPRGPLRVSSPVGLTSQLLTPVVQAFLQQYPQVQLDLLLVNRRVDLINEGIDVALRVREADDEEPNLITRRLREAQTEVVAAPHFAAGRSLTHPRELLDLPFLGALDPDRLSRTRLFNASGERFDLAMPARLGVEDFTMRKQAALAGLGFTVLPMMYCEAELAEGTLVRLLPQWHCPPAWLQAVYPHRRGVLPAVRAWLEHLTHAFDQCAGRPI
ncbi:LysR family transcriptional regulator [Pseudomonas sp. RIT412]|uniref:LysR substrate-binding domain-containing protein n=1 Tax=Pseudomonas sp. RIT409 TaxID=2202159 RepID=UPI000D37B083|nr:LysR substrate-binding domain-containing protein [Pseudomonas sp. RIT 409]RAU48163.1 LysR family transcriptional regulator [Pseudomonas sp. RIT 409]RAU55253.1 LysR family transcriptional regulator [Pseudomonas sp. RIT 412]